ncbi:MAG: immunoglobulin domain-containing protein [Bacteroidota bacterium]
MPNMSWYGMFNFNVLSIMDKNTMQAVRAVRAFSSTEANGYTFFSITAEQPIPVSINTQPIAKNVCIGTNVQFIIADTGTGPFTYQWKKDNEIIQNANYNWIHINNTTANDDGIYTCEVTNLCRTVTSNSAKLNVIEITANSGGAMGFCDNFAVQINASANTNHPELGNLNISWTPTTNLSNPNILNPIATLSNHAFYTLNVSDANGCSASSYLNINKVTYTADAGSDRYLTCGDSIQFANINTNFYFPESTYQWSPSTGLNSDTLSTPKAAPTATTTYTLNINGPYGCSATDQIIVNVNPFEVNAGMNQNISCGDSIQLQANTNNYSQNQNYDFSWSPSSNLSNDSILNPYTRTVNTTMYYLSANSANGCHSFDSVLITVNPFYVNTGMPITLHCGDTATLPLYVYGTSATNFAYQWEPAVGLSSDTIKNPLINITDSTTYHITASLPNGCQAKDSININVIPFSINLTTANIPCGDSIQLQPIINYLGTDSLSYSWSPSIGLSDSAKANPWVEISSNQNYTLHVATANGCESSAMQTVNMAELQIPNICMVTVDSNNKNMIIWEKPVDASIDSFYIYKESNTTNQYNIIATVAFDSLSIFVDNNSNPSTQSSKYKISYSNSCDMTSQMSDFHKTMHLSINQGSGTTWNLIWEPYEGFTPSSYIIYRGTDPNNLTQIGSTSASSTQYSDLTAPSGFVYYQVGVLSPSNCNPTKSYQLSLSNIKSNNPDDINENAQQIIQIEIYPNPASTNLTIDISKLNEQIAKLKIYNSIGEISSDALIFSE